MKKKIAQTRENVQKLTEVKIVEREAGKFDIVTEFLGSVLGPRLLKSQDEDFPDKPHKNLSLSDAITHAAWWNDWIIRQNGGPKKAKK